MRKPFIAVALAIASALAVSVGAQTPASSAAPVPNEVSGTVLSTGNILMLVRGDDGQDRSLVLLNSTQMPDERIPAGERVRVRYRPIDGDRFEAVSIEPVPANAALATTPAPSAADDSSAAPWPAVATVTSLAWLVLALGVTIFVAAYLVSVRRHHHHHMH
jgi:hypothetical protein